MVRRSVLALLLSLSLLAGFSATAWAGGTATIELDKHPGEIEAGKPVTIGFMMLQHGIRPVEGGEPAMEAVHRETRETLRAEGRPEGEVGHYVIEVTFLEAGVWTWSISAHPFPQTTSFPALTVVAPGQLGQGAPLLSVAGIVVPRCGDAATPLFMLSAFTGLDGAVPDNSSDDDAILRSDSILDVPFQDLIATRAAISVTPSEGAALACGEMLAEPVDGELIVGLSEVDGSGYVGFARITDGNDQSIVEVYLAPGLTDSTALPPAAKIEIVNQTFGPATVEIPAGSTVTWVNNDPVMHEVAFADIALDDSGPLHQSQEFSQRFDTPGTYEYVCGPHPFMTGTIVVK
jgi:plastocyanin